MKNLPSHPAWVCGLKLIFYIREGIVTSVTPCVGVWIETSMLSRKTWFSTSHPAWVCGLKPSQSGGGHSGQVSHPAWVCGLKPPPGSIILRAHWSHPAWVCGLKLANLRTATKGTLSSHPAWVCGLKHHYALHCFKRNMSHPAWVCGLKLFHLHRWIIL